MLKSANAGAPRTRRTDLSDPGVAMAGADAGDHCHHCCHWPTTEAFEAFWRSPTYPPPVSARHPSLSWLRSHRSSVAQGNLVVSARSFREGGKRDARTGHIARPAGGRVIYMAASAADYTLARHLRPQPAGLGQYYSDCRNQRAAPTSWEAYHPAHSQYTGGGFFSAPQLFQAAHSICRQVFDTTFCQYRSGHYHYCQEAGGRTPPTNTVAPE